MKINNGIQWYIENDLYNSNTPEAQVIANLYKDKKQDLHNDLAQFLKNEEDITNGID